MGKVSDFLKKLKNEFDAANYVQRLQREVIALRQQNAALTEHGLNLAQILANRRSMEQTDANLKVVVDFLQSSMTSTTPEGIPAPVCPICKQEMHVKYTIGKYEATCNNCLPEK